MWPVSTVYEPSRPDRLRPAIASIAIHTPAKMIVEPKSGCFMSRTATTPVKPAEIQKTGRDLSCSRSDKSQAMAMTKKGLRNSDGCSWPTPSSIQRTAPFFSQSAFNARMVTAGL